MVRLILMVLSVYVCQTTLSQVNLNLDIDARQLTHMKLSDISEESRYVALKMDSIVDFIATDNFLFVSTGGFFSTKLHQYDFSGNIIRTTHNDKKFGFMVDSKNSRLIHGYADKLEIWDYDGAFLNSVSLPEQSNSDNKSIIGFDQNNICDLFHTGTCDNYQIQGDFLVFRKQSNDLPDEMNVEEGHTVIFITKLKQ